MSTVINENITVRENGTTLKDLTVNGSIIVEADNVSIVNCKIIAKANAIISRGKYLIARNNLIECDGVAISLRDGSYNCLVAENDANGSINISQGYNCSLILNRAKNITAINNKNVYIIENEVASTVRVLCNDYIIADKNTFASLSADRNTNVNGDTLTDVNERLKVGANRNILPHTNKDLFVGMEVQNTVPSPENGIELPIAEYIPAMCREKDRVIIAPGAYYSERIDLYREHSNTRIYAYGVYAESPRYQRIMSISNAENIEVLGLTAGYAVQSAHQLHVLDVQDGYIITIVAPGHVTTLEDKPRGYTVVDNMYATATAATTSATRNDDGTYTMGYEVKPRRKICKGDVLYFRVSNPTEGSFNTARSQGIVYKDVVLYGQSSGLAFVEHANLSHVTYYRVHNTNRAPYVIDRESYEYYKMLEKKYNVCLEVYIDGLGRCRGSVPRIGSVDATHIMSCREGAYATSCLFEHMCDDGSNHRGSSARLASVTDNGDGTATLVYKPNLAEVYYLHYNQKKGSLCHPFHTGDRAYIYTSKGQLVCDTPVLCDETIVGTGFSSFTEVEYEMRAIKVKSADVNFAALEGFDLSDDHYRLDNKVLVDNSSQNSQGFRFDNVLVDGLRSRGFMVKAPNGIIENCTFTNLNESGIGIKTEINWSESTIAHDVTVRNCIFSNVSSLYGHNDYKPIAPLSILGFSKIAADGYLPYENIVIEGNRFENCDHKYCITVNSAKNLKILNNTFCPINHEYEGEDRTPITIDIDTAVDVEISGNTFTKNASSPLELIHAVNYRNVYGTDISDENGNSLLPDSVNE